MRKYLHILKMSIKENYKTIVNTIIAMVGFVVIIYVFLKLWEYLYGTGGYQMIEGYTLVQMLWYLVGTEIISYTARGKYLILGVSDDIKSGKIIYQLNKPYNFYTYSVVNHYGETLLKSLFLIPIGVGFGLILLGPIPHFSFLYIIPILVAFLLSGILVSVAYAVIALLAFWVEDAMPFGWIFEKFTMLFGLFFPPELFPAWLQPVITYSPVYAIYSGPAKLLSNFSFELFGQVVLIQAAYIVLFIVLGLFTFNRGKKKVNINGG